MAGWRQGLRSVDIYHPGQIDHIGHITFQFQKRQPPHHGVPEVGQTDGVGQTAEYSAKSAGKGMAVPIQ
jgi:hypothetical protein